VQKKEKSKGKKGDKKEKTFTKTYVRAEHYDGEHVAYNWEKPDWAQNINLRSTGKGEEVRNGGNLANPITFPNKKPVNADIEQEEQEEEFEKINTEEVIRRLKGGDKATRGLIPLPSYRGRQRNLRFSILGAKIRDGGDLVKPITKATVYRKPEDVNRLARPENLRLTSIGSKVRQGENIAAPVTQATVLRTPEDINHVANKNVLKNKGVTPQMNKKYEWQKPEWAKKKNGVESPSGTDSSTPCLQAAKEERGDTMNGAIKGAAPLTPEKKKYEWQKPAWAAKRDAVLKKTDKGEVVRSGDNLARPITQLPELARKESVS
jgi:hypothetical protein